MKAREERATGRTAKGLAHIDPRHGNAGVQKLLEHPALLLAWQTRQSGRIPDPRFGGPRGITAGRNKEGGVALNRQNFARQRQFLGWALAVLRRRVQGRKTE